MRPERWGAGMSAGQATAGSARAEKAGCTQERARVGWRAWRARFGLAEVCGTVAAIGGFAVGYLALGSLLAAAGLATMCEAAGFYGCVGIRTSVAASRATAHLAGFRRLAAGVWHAVTAQLASCAIAEAMDGFLVRPWCLAGASWLARPLPGGVWLGFAVGKAAADLVWYAMEAVARRGIAAPAGRSGTDRADEDPDRAQSPFLADMVMKSRAQDASKNVAGPWVVPASSRRPLAGAASPRAVRGW